MKRANIGAILNFDLQKVSQIKTLGIMSYILIRYPHDKNLEIIQPISSGVIALFVFWFWPPGGQTKNQIGPKFGL
jgi:hypothetical protein